MTTANCSTDDLHEIVWGEALPCKNYQEYGDIYVLTRDGKRFRGHSMVLSLHIPESILSKGLIRISFDSENIVFFAEYFYRFELLLENALIAFDFWLIGEQFGIKELTKESSKYFYQKAKVKDFIRAAVRCYDENREIHRHIAQQLAFTLDAVVNDDEFFTLPNETICEIVRNDIVIITDEEEMFKIVVQWMRKDKSEDLDLAASLTKPKVNQENRRLIQMIRYPQCSKKFFTKIAYYWLMYFSCQHLIDEYFDYRDYMLGHNLDKLHIKYSFRMEQRLSFKTVCESINAIKCDLSKSNVPSTSSETFNEVSMEVDDSNVCNPNENLIVFGSIAGIDACRGRFMNAKNKEWTELPDLGVDNLLGANFCFVSPASIFISGGAQHGKSLSRNAVILNYQNKSIERLPQMKIARRCHASIEFNGEIFVVGGIGLNQRALCKIERLNLLEKKWKFLVGRSNQSMHQCRYYPTVIIYRNCLFVIGGSDGKRVFKSVEYFNFNQKRWNRAKNMNFRRQGASATVYNDRIYVMGGSTRLTDTETATVEYFDYDTNEWKLVASLNLERDHIQSCVYQNRLIAVGGYDSMAQPLAIAEEYDVEKDEWKLSAPLSGFKEQGGGIIAPINFNIFE